MPVSEIKRDRNGKVGALEPTTIQTNLLPMADCSNIKKHHCNKHRYAKILIQVYFNINNEVLLSEDMITKKLDSLCEAETHK